MDRPTLARAACVGLALTVLVSLFVLSGTGWALADPEQRAAGDGHVGEATLAGTVVATDPVTVALDDGQEVVIPDAEAADVAAGDTVEVAITVSEPGATADIEAGPGQRPLMYLVSALAGLLVLARVLDTWRIHPLQLRVEPREKPVHHRLIRRYRGGGYRVDREPEFSRVPQDEREQDVSVTDGRTSTDGGTAANRRTATDGGTTADGRTATDGGTTRAIRRPEEDPSNG